MNQENYCALALSIIDGCLPETAWARLNNPHPETVKAVILPEDINLMKRYRKHGLTYKQIGDIYGLSMDIVYSRIRRNGARTRKQVLYEKDLRCSSLPG